jgi:hypothetical protein
MLKAVGIDKLQIPILELLLLRLFIRVVRTERITGILKDMVEDLGGPCIE